MSRSLPGNVRLTPSPFAAFYLTCGLSSVMMVPGILQALNGSRDAACIVVFLSLLNLLMLVLGLIGRRSFIAADREAITVRHNGQDTVIPWTNVRACVMMPQVSRILIYWAQNGQTESLTCYYSKRNAAFVQSCAAQHSILLHMP